MLYFYLILADMTFSLWGSQQKSLPALLCFIDHMINQEKERSLKMLFQFLFGLELKHILVVNDLTITKVFMLFFKKIPTKIT